MSTFYVLPSRAVLGSRLATFLKELLPGVQMGTEDWEDMADELIGTVVQAEESYVIYRDDLPEGVALADALAAGFGVEPGDAIIEVKLSSDRKSRVTSGPSAA